NGIVIRSTISNDTSTMTVIGIASSSNPMEYSAYVLIFVNVITKIIL
ncbi:18184_t:CDS:1, partial [Cetraspora pellucida]